MSKKLSPREKQQLQANGLKFSVVVSPDDPSIQLYRLNDGKEPDHFNTIRARSPLHAIDKINKRYIYEFKVLRFRLKQTQARAAWHRARSPLKAVYHEKAETYWTERINAHENRFQDFSEQWPADNPLTDIDETLITFPDPEDFDIDDGQ